MPLTFHDYLKRDGWIPKSKYDADRSIVKRIANLRNVPVGGKIEFSPAVKALEELIESDPDLYMGFEQMYVEAQATSAVSACIYHC